MTGTRSVRIIATNDFFGSFAPSPTSYGALPGGEGLRRTVARLRAGQPTIWADVGDFSGGPLAALAGGSSGFEAAADLGIDVAAAGNHEFDRGLAHLQACAPKLGFPLLCANADADLPGTALLPTEAGAVGFVGLTMPGADLNPPFGRRPSGPAGPLADRALERVVPAAARQLRADGAAFVVALLHDGVDLRSGRAGRPVVDPARLVALCQPWAASVDAILAGHTVVGRWFGQVAGVPVAQPWAYGAEVAVIELARDAPARVRGVMVEPAGAWMGRGTDLLDLAGRQVVGHLPTALRWPNARRPTLLDFAAAALRRATGADAAVVMAWTGGVNTIQPAPDGVQAFLPAGPVAEIDLLRAVPWPSDATVRLTVALEEWEEIVRTAASPPLAPTAQGRGGSDVRPHMRSRRTMTAAMTAYTAAEMEGWLGRAWEWADAGYGLRAALKEALQ